MEAFYILWKNVKWRFQNPVTIMMSLTQPLVWLLLFTTMFAGGTQGYTAFALPGILAMLVLTGAGMSGIALYPQKAKGSYYRIYISPAGRGAIVLGHLLDAIVLACIEIFVVFLIAMILGVRVASDPAGFLLIMALLFAGVFFIAGLSYALSFAFTDENPFIAIVTTCTLPLVFISTALMPYESIPHSFRIPVLINPFTHLINSVRSLILSSLNYIDWKQIAYTAAFFIALCIFTFIIALRALKKDRG